MCTASIYAGMRFGAVDASAIIEGFKAAFQWVGADPEGIQVPESAGQLAVAYLITKLLEPVRLPLSTFITVRISRARKARDTVQQKVAPSEHKKD